MKKLLVLLIAIAILACTVSALRMDKASGVAAKAAAPKLVAKTTYDVKWVAGPDGKLIEQKTPKKQLFQVIQKKTSMTDPTDPSKTITVDVPTEVPYVPNRKATGKVDQLKSRYQALKKRENELKAQYAQAKSHLVDFPVLEDGAPAPPDAQEVEFREELYGELAATQFPKAKNIQQHILDGARTFVEGAGATREKTWDMFEKMKKKMLVPSHGWSMSMIEESESESPEANLSLMEVGAQSTISSEAAKPLQEVAQLLVEANKNIQRLHQSRKPYNVIKNHIAVQRQINIQLPEDKDYPGDKPTPKGHVNAELIPKLQQPQIHDPHRFGTKHPIKAGHAFVSAEIVGEDGKPYAPRKQWKGISDEPETFRSPFAKYIHPPKVGSSADVVNKDPNTKLTPIEQKSIESLQLRLKSLLDRLGANIVWDHTPVANRRLISEYDAIKTESRTLMEEYELRTGVKTIAWQLQENDIRGLTVPTGAVTDIHFQHQPELASRPLQRPGSHKTPQMTDAQVKELKIVHGVTPKQPQEQLVNVAWKQQADGVVKAKVNLKVVDSKVPLPGQPPNMASRATVPGKKYPSGRVGRPSQAVQIDVVAPASELLTRNMGMAGEPKKEDAPAPHISLLEFHETGKLPDDDTFSQVRSMIGPDEEVALRNAELALQQEADETTPAPTAFVETGAEVGKVRSFCEICILVMQMKERGQPHLCAGLNTNYHITCIETLESILRADKAIVYWLKNGCMHMDSEGPEIVRPCPAINICSWVPNLFADAPSLVRDGVDSLCPKDPKFLPTIPMEFRNLLGATDNTAKDTSATDGPVDPNTRGL